ncbi:dihydroneopterin aldolase [Aquirhabdus parva]|uniref:7,8-dihydroneopterin aldolase n=1 Tax=Aquirhabdus parva TaxID=2283318 RepID=A0A345P5Z2_9GAMM|nr:dihydroneopterin aldolase [Aquirhabdus parva]AXI02701.1 dihydroneopterin aldolase [Aquirhabdus parva]
MDKVLIEGLRVNAVIGVFDWERQIEQPILIDIVMLVDTRAAAVSDDLNDAVNYALASEQITELTQSLQPQLLETLADRLAEMLLNNYPTVESVQVRVKKPLAVKSAQAVGIEIIRERHALLARSGK